MSATAITKDVLKLNTPESVTARSAADATDGATIAFNCASSKTLIIIENTSVDATPAPKAGSVVLKGGNGFNAYPDMTIALDASEVVALVIESAGYKNTSGDNKGKIVFLPGTGSTFKVGCFVLP